MSNPYAPPDPSTPRPEPRGRDVARRTSGSRPPQPQQPPPTPEQLADAGRAVMRFGLLMLAALLTSRLPVPWQVASPVFALAAVVVGLRSVVRVRRAGVRGVLPAMLGGGIALSVVLLLSSLTMLALWPAQVERQQCLDSALTIAAQEQCERAFQEAVTERAEPTG